MAAIYPDEGLDLRLGILPKNGANFATLYLGCFVSQTPNTVPARNATGGAVPSGWTETTYPGYARQAIAAASWGAESTVGDGRLIAAPQVQMPTVGAGPSESINGYFIATLVSSQAGDVIVHFANFDDLTAFVTSDGAILRITPRWREIGILGGA